MIKIHLSRILGEKRWHQSDLANKTGIRPNTINAIYHEYIARIDLAHIDLICEALECQVNDLLEYVPKRNYKKRRN